MINLSIIKSASVANAIIGDIIDYKLVVQNNENIDLNKVFVYDILSSILEFVEGSVKVDNTILVDGNIISGINLGTIKKGEKKEITFKAKAIASGIVNNKATGSFYYVELPNTQEQYGSDTSNISVVEIAKVLVNISKEANKDFAVLGEVVEYTIKVTNVGELDAKNVFVKDTVSSNLEVQDGTVTINGIVVNNINLSKGVNIGTVKKGETSLLKYSAIIKSVPCNGKVTNIVAATYSYILKDGSLGRSEAKGEGKEISILNVGINNFKQFSVEEKLIIPVKKPDIEDILTINGDIEILKSHVIQSPSGVSNEGQSLTGYKLIIYGKVNEVVEYTALDVEQSVHSAHYSVPFTAFIVLPGNYCIGKGLEISGEVEHIYFNKISDREIFSNATVMIKAILCGTCEK